MFQIGTKLDAPFETRMSPSGIAVISLKTEPKWSATAPAPAASAAASAGAPSVAASVGAAGGSAILSSGAAGGVPTRVYRASTLSLEERVAIVRSVGEECIQEDELLALLSKKVRMVVAIAASSAATNAGALCIIFHRPRPTPSAPSTASQAHPVCYDGFEPSGRMHIAQGILKAINVNKLTAAGCVFKFWVADWFALLNNKLDGDLKKIQTVGRYMIEVWKAAGMDMTNVEFLWASEEINGHSNDYWLRVMNIARAFTLKRFTRCCTIMGREESDDLSAAQIFYPAMQCADIFHLKVRVWNGGGGGGGGGF